MKIILPVEQRVGGIVIRQAADQVEYLLVTSKSQKDRWIFPAGHVEVGESYEEAALREVVEEAGVEAVPIFNLGNFQYPWYRGNQKIVIDTFLFLMRYVRTIEINPEGRQVEFFTFNRALELNIWEESRVFLQKVHEFSGKVRLDEKGLMTL